MLSTINLVDSVIDEVALEGLDGLTLEALWDRLAMRFQEKAPFPQPFKEQVWNICCQIRELHFYELETPREKLVIFDRYEFVDPDLGIILEPDVVPKDIYPHSPIDDVKNGIKGSCSTYYTRKKIDDVAKKLKLDEALNKYGQTLVIVASQTVRQDALMPKSVCPTLELTETQYCFLERVGRARYHGEVTQGKLSLSLLNEDPKSLFYHRKFLLRHKLITKQMHHQKSGGHSCSGSLLHLPRFYVERKPKVIYLAERVIDILKCRDNQVAEYSEIKKELGIENSIKKLFKTSFFQKVVKTDLVVPYRTLYPNADDLEWQCKHNPSKEKMLRVVQLLDSNIDINDLWNKDEVIEEDDPFELDISQIKYNVNLLRQANAVVEASKHDGLGKTELGKIMGLPKLQSRIIFRNLAKSNIVAMYMNDMGRQRVTKYVSRKYEHYSKMSKQLKREMVKMQRLTEPDVKIEVVGEKCKQSEADSMNIDANASECSAVDETKQTEDRNRQIVFDATNRILVQYKLTGCRKAYKRTFQDVAKNKFDPEAASRKKMKILEEKLCIAEPIAATQRTGNDIVGLMKEMKTSNMTNVSNVTYRLLRRANMIIELVKANKVVDDMTKLIKLITEEEEREGYDVRIDKKSLIRLLQRLAKDNLVKNIKLTLSTNAKRKSLTFICDPSIDVNHTVIRSAVEQAKIKFCLIGTQKVKTVLQTATEKIELPAENTKQLQSSDKPNKSEKKSKDVLPPDLTFDRKAGREYGFSPKFIRMQTLHAFLFYIIYEHAGKPRGSKETLLAALRAKGVSIDETLAKQIGGVFNLEVGWKMFVPPLPKHSGWPSGWALMCDILLRIPLSIFLKVHNVSYKIPELEEYTNHPIKKHLLVKDMPPQIRNVLLIKRKYIFSIHDVVTRLCYIGLLQFGAQKLKEKDKVFIYLNRNTELMDTTTSAAHYHKIEAKMYPVTKYTFTTLQTVDKYWYKLWTTCINTRLGGRLVVQGKDIILEDLEKKTEMIEATKARTPEEALIEDDGHVPGDHMGAAGIDSALFSHLKRNWNWDSSNYPFEKGCGQFDRADSFRFASEREAHMSRVKPKPVRFTDFYGLKRVTGPTIVDAGELKKSTKSPVATVPKSSNKKCPKTNRTILNKTLTSSRQRCYVRRVMPRRQPIRARVKYDEIDYNALLLMDKLRVDWDTREDNILLVCKVAMLYLCPNPRSQIITFTAVRDVLRSYSLTSGNKTSRACQRRLHYMLKQPQTANSVALGVEELKQNFYVNRRFGDIVDKLKKEYRNPNEKDEQVTLVFRDLVAYIAKKHYDISDIQSSTMNYSPTTVAEFKLLNTVKHPTKSTSIQGFRDECTNDIHSATINSVIHSSMCCGKDRRSWAYQLFRIYQQYPEWLLRSGMARIRADQMVSIKKHYVFAMRKQTNACMPMSSSQYQLSSGYTQKFNTKLPYSVFKESYEFFIKLVRYYYEKCVAKLESVEEGGVETGPVTGGTVAAIHEYINLNQLDFDLEIPQHIIMLDPTLQKDDERYIRIARRYQDILRNLEHIQMEVNPDLGNGEKARIEVVEEEKNDISQEGRSTSEGIVEASNLGVGKNAVERKLEETSRLVNVGSQEIESDREINFEEEEDDDGEEEDGEDEEEDENDFVFLIGTTEVRLTETDIERSRLKINIDNVRPTSSEVGIRKNKRKNPVAIEEAHSRKKIRVETVETKCKQLSTETSTSSMRVNEIIERANCLRKSHGSFYRPSDSNDVEKRYTRIALLKMREELNDLTPADSHHAHEYFVLNMFKMFHSFDESKLKNPTELSSIHDLRVPKELLPMKRDVYEKIIADLKTFAIFPKDYTSYKKFKRNLQANDLTKRSLDAVYEFIREKREVGASWLELGTKFYSILGDDLYDVVSILTKGRLILRSGARHTRYIHQKFADPWMIHSYKIMRLQKECLPILPAESLYVVVDEKNKESENINSAATDGNQAGFEEDPDLADDGKKNRGGNDADASQSGQRKIQKSRTCLLQRKEIYRAAKQLDLDTAEEIRVVVRPWIRIDGALNRRVLDRMLGGVLCYCLVHPGVHLIKVQEKFAPAIQPFHTKELVEILATLECLQIGKAKKAPITLFSKSQSSKPLFFSIPERSGWTEEELIIEPMLGAVLKFSMFLSNRTYTSDFLSL